MSSELLDSDADPGLCQDTVNKFKHLHRKGHITMGKLVAILIFAALAVLAIVELGFNILEMREQVKNAVTIQVCQMPDLPRANAVCEY